MSEMRLTPRSHKSQIVIGSDVFYPWQPRPVDHISASASLSDDEQANILGRTAAKLFKRSGLTTTPNQEQAPWRAN